MRSSWEGDRLVLGLSRRSGRHQGPESTYANFPAGRGSETQDVHPRGPHVVSGQVLRDFPARASVTFLTPQRALRCFSVHKIRGASVGSVLGASAASWIWEISCLSPRGRVFQEEGTASAEAQR